MRRNYGSYSVNKVADVLNLSRNTVSKVLNNKPGVSEKTRQAIWDYIKKSSQPRIYHNTHISTANSANTIMFSYKLENVEYLNGLLSGMQREMQTHGYLLSVNTVTNGSKSPFFPQSVYSGSVCGIISFNIYDNEYWNEVISLGIPSVFFDMGYNQRLFTGKTDVINSENKRAFYEAIIELYHMGHRRFAYFGDPYFCNSLNQRWHAFQTTLEECELKPDTSNCILDDFSHLSDEECYRQVYHRINSTDHLPDVYICASDRQAILLIRVLKELSIRIPEQIAVMGFDNLPESMRQLPPLSTVECNLEYHGQLAVRKILERLCDPSKPHEYIECEASLILRESTGHNSSKVN